MNKKIVEKDKQTYLVAFTQISFMYFPKFCFWFLVYIRESNVFPSIFSTRCASCENALFRSCENGWGVFFLTEVEIYNDME